MSQTPLYALSIKWGQGLWGRVAENIVYSLHLSKKGFITSLMASGLLARPGSCSSLAHSPLAPTGHSRVPGMQCETRFLAGTPSWECYLDLHLPLGRLWKDLCLTRCSIPMPGASQQSKCNRTYCMNIVGQGRAPGWPKEGPPRSLWSCPGREGELEACATVDRWLISD